MNTEQGVERGPGHVGREAADVHLQVQVQEQRQQIESETIRVREKRLYTKGMYTKGEKFFTAVGNEQTPALEITPSKRSSSFKVVRVALIVVVVYRTAVFGPEGTEALPCAPPAPRPL